MLRRKKTENFIKSLSFLLIFVPISSYREWLIFQDLDKQMTMSEYSKNLSPRRELRQRIVESALIAFTTYGIRSITMDEIAASLGISKRTLYEVFSDKETLLEACVMKSQEEMDTFVVDVLANSSNVLEVILKIFQKSIERFHATNKRFFEDIKKYPKAYELMTSRREKDSEETISFFKEGVSQGLFREDVNFEIMGLLVREQMNLLLNTDICDKYSFLAVYESIMFTYLRGISTQKGAQELESFIQEYRGRL